MKILLITMIFGMKDHEEIVYDEQEDEELDVEYSDEEEQPTPSKKAKKIEYEHVATFETEEKFVAWLSESEQSNWTRSFIFLLNFNYRF